MGGNIPGGFSGWEFSGVDFPGGSLMGGNFPGGNFPGGNFPRTDLDICQNSKSLNVKLLNQLTVL